MTPLPIQIDFGRGYQQPREDGEHTTWTLTATGKARIKQIPENTPEWLILCALESEGCCTAQVISEHVHISTVKVGILLRKYARMGTVKRGGVEGV